MMTFIVLSDAQAEIDNALANSTQSVEFREVIEAMWVTLLNQPAIAPRVPCSTCRRYLMPKYPYSAIYRPGATEFIVVAFSHHRQRPGYLRYRLKQI